MLETLYTTFFRPQTTRPAAGSALAIALGVLLVLALNAAGALSAGPAGLVGLFLLFSLGAVLGVFWLTAALHLLAHLLGGQGSAAQTLGAVLQSLWPLLLTGPAVAALTWSRPLGILLSLGINLGVLTCGVAALKRVHTLDWVRATACFGLSLLLAQLALAGLAIWPAMIILGM